MATTRRCPPAPQSAGEAGRRLWRAVQLEYSLTGADLELLRQAVVMADQLAALEKLVYAAGPLIRDKDGSPTANPASVQHRLLAISFGRTLAALRVIADEAPGDATRTQHRSGFRGTYSGLRAVE